MQKILLAIDGMSCAACVQNIQKSLKKHPLVQDIQINLIAKTAAITLNPSTPESAQKSIQGDIQEIQEISVEEITEEIISAIRKLGYKPRAIGAPTSSMGTTSPTNTGAKALWSAGQVKLAPSPAPNLAPAPTITKPKLTPNATHALESPARNTRESSRLDSGSSAHVKNASATSHTSPAIATPTPESKPLARAIHAFSKLNALNDRLLTSRLKLIIAALCAGAVLYLSMLPMVFDSVLVAPFDDMRVNFAAQLLCALMSMHVAREYYFKGFAALFAKTPTMDSLVAISTSAAFVYSVYGFWQGGFAMHGFEAHGQAHSGGHWYFESVCVIIFFILVGKALESSAKDKTNAVINALLERDLPEVIRIDSATRSESSIQSMQICAGDRLRILPGQMIPVDGVLSEGVGDVDESMLTGESLPVQKRAGDPLLAGSINTTRALIMQATSTSRDSTLSALSDLVHEAMSSKPSLARLADRIASVFVPAVMLIALVSFGVWAWLEGVEFGFSIFISVLVISCPCALGLATPMAVMIGSALANKQGAFVRHAQSFENLSKLSHIVFDKTGTLTQNALQVVGVIGAGSLARSAGRGGNAGSMGGSVIGEREILALAAGLEKGSEHIIAKAIIKEAQARGLALSDLPEFSDVSIETGAGVRGRARVELDSHAESREYRIGSSEMFGDMIEPLTMPAMPAINDSHICVYIGRESSSTGSGYEILGAILLADSLKPEIPATIAALHKQGITLHILSGDREPNTAQIAKTLGIEHYKSQAKPHDKLAYIHALQKRGEVVMMVGDGVNDVGALMAADISLSFSHASDVSKNAADIIIYHDDMTRLVSLINLSRAVIGNIRENLFFAFIYNAICIPLACGVAYYPAGILLSPMIAAFAMSASSVCVVLNSQRLWRFRS